MLNHICYQGRLVEDASCGTTNSGAEYANFRLAWSEKYKERENKCFLECKAFNGTAKFISEYMSSKGKEILVEGKLTTETWENNDGQKRSKLVLLVSAAHFCGKNTDGTQTQGNASAETPAENGGGFTAVEDDNLPF